MLVVAALATTTPITHRTNLESTSKCLPLPGDCPITLAKITHAILFFESM
jgi:hypothetical protein